MTVNLRCTTHSNGFLGGAFTTQLYWRPGTPGGSVADATDIAARVRAFWAFVAGRITTGTIFTVDGLCAAIEDTTGNLVGAFQGTNPASVTASGAGGSVTAQSQVEIQARTNTVIAGKFLRGRIYVPLNVKSDTTTDGGLIAAAITAFSSGATAMLTGGATASFPVVWHRPGVAAGSSAAVTGYTTWSKYANLRTRRD